MRADCLVIGMGMIKGIRDSLKSSHLAFHVLSRSHMILSWHRKPLCSLKDMAFGTRNFIEQARVFARVLRLNEAIHFSDADMT